MDSLRQEKDLLRAQVKSLSSNLKVSLFPLLEEGILKKGSTSVFMGVFNPLNDEPILKDLPTDVELCWPYIVDQVLDRTLGEMEFSSADEFKKSELGFLEPSHSNRIPKNEISVILVPGQAFDFKGNRLGRGRGFYDRYLKDFNGISVGVCSRERFLMKPIPVDQNDVAVQYILTEQFLYKVNPVGKVV